MFYVLVGVSCYICGFLMGTLLERYTWNKLTRENVIGIIDGKPVKAKIGDVLQSGMIGNANLAGAELKVCSKCGGNYWAECPCTGHERIK